MELFKVISIDETKNIIDREFNYRLGHERVKLSESTGRIVYGDIKSGENVPGFKRSTVDGYAVNSKDVFGASETMESIMSLKGETLMGQPCPGDITFPGDCFYVPTGGMLPDGADSVVMIEYTEKLDDDTVLVNRPSSPGENVIEVGEDIRCGETIISSGTKLRPYEIGVLASLGITYVDVYKKPVVGIISTGDEIVPSDKTPKIGQVRDINSHLLYSSVTEDGGEPVLYGLINDDYDLLYDTVNRAVNECDIVLISGGSSVGKKDQTLKVIDSVGKPGILVHGISVKPGKPTVIGKAKEKIIFGLPGHPLACAVIYRIIVKYFMERITGNSEVPMPVQCRFSINYHKARGREEYLPVTLERKENEIMAHPVFGKSGIITAFSKAWGYVRIERNVEGLKEGQIVYAYRL